MFRLEFKTDSLELRNSDGEADHAALIIGVIMLLDNVTKQLSRHKTSAKILDNKGKIIGKWSLSQEEDSC